MQQFKESLVCILTVVKPLSRNVCTYVHLSTKLPDTAHSSCPHVIIIHECYHKDFNSSGAVIKLSRDCAVLIAFWPKSLKKYIPWGLKLFVIMAFIVSEILILLSVQYRLCYVSYNIACHWILRLASISAGEKRASWIKSPSFASSCFPHKLDLEINRSPNL